MASRRSPKSAPGFYPCRGSTEHMRGPLPGFPRALNPAQRGPGETRHGFRVRGMSEGCAPRPGPLHRAHPDAHAAGHWSAHLVQCCRLGLTNTFTCTGPVRSRRMRRTLCKGRFTRDETQHSMELDSIRRGALAVARLLQRLRAECAAAPG